MWWTRVTFPFSAAFLMAAGRSVILWYRRSTSSAGWLCERQATTWITVSRIRRATYARATAPKTCATRRKGTLSVTGPHLLTRSGLS